VPRGGGRRRRLHAGVEGASLHPDWSL
jgi:hypothetical protein